MNGWISRMEERGVIVQQVQSVLVCQGLSVRGKSGGKVALCFESGFRHHQQCCGLHFSWQVLAEVILVTIIATILQAEPSPQPRQGQREPT